jgi:hypothetical protein
MDSTGKLAPAINCDAITLSLFAEHLLRVALQPLTDQELQALNSVLPQDVDELTPERQIHFVQASSDTSAASRDRGAVTSLAGSYAEPSNLPLV